MCSAYIHGPTYIPKLRAWGEVHCPLRHPSRDITKIRFHMSKVSDFDKKWGKYHFCDAPLNYTVLDLIFYRSKHLPTHLYVADVFPPFLGFVLIGREQPNYCRRLSEPGSIYTSPATCFGKLDVGHCCLKNREHYSILTHGIMECLASPYNSKTTLNCEYM